MRTFAREPKGILRVKSAKTAIPRREYFGQSREVSSILNLQRKTGNQAAERLPQVKAEGLELESNTTAADRFAHDFARIPVGPDTPGAHAVSKVQAKPKISAPRDRYEQEADRVADQIMRMPDPQPRGCRAEQSGQQKLQTESVLRGHDPEWTTVSSVTHQAASSGQPLDSTTRGFMEARFGLDFSVVRVHTDAQAGEAARAVNARAYTSGRDIVFGRSQYAPATKEGRHLFAHELAHVVQQGTCLSGTSAPLIQRVVGGDVTQMSITPDFAHDLTDRELEEQIRVVRNQISMDMFDSPENEEIAQVNLMILEAESGRRGQEGAPRSEERRQATAREGYQDQGVVFSYDRIVSEETMSNPNPQSGFDQSEINRIAHDPRLLEQVYYDAASGNPRARWLVQQYEGVAGALGRYIARELNAWKCLIINCTVDWERIIFSPSTRSGRHLRSILSDAFEREARRIGLQREIISHVLMLLVAGATARGVLAREAGAARAGMPSGEAAAVGRAGGEARVAVGGGQPVVVYRGTTYRFIEGRSRMVHDLGDGTYWTYEMSQGVRFAQLRRAQVQSVEPGAPGVVLRAEVHPAELGRVMDFYNNPALRGEWEAFVRSQPGGRYVLQGGPSEIYNGHLQNWLQSRGIRLQDFDVIVGPDYIHGGSQICIRNPGIAARVLSRAREAARAHEPVTPSYPEIPEY